VRDGDRYTLAPHRGETMMFLLTGLFGLPTFVGEVSAERFRQAVRENRAVALDVVRDGFGGGMVWVHRIEPDSDASPYDLVFPCGITDAILDCLRRNHWERPSQMFEPG
jgi:hypothetical protein